MAIKKILQIEGSSFIQSSFGQIDFGIQKTTFLAVCKVLSVQGNKDQINIDIVIQGDAVSYKCQYAFAPSVADGSSNFIRQAYIYLKTLPEFAGAEDC